MLRYPHFHRALSPETYQTEPYGNGESGGALTFAVGVVNAAGCASIARCIRNDGRIDAKEFVISFCAHAVRLNEIFQMTDNDLMGFHRIVRALETTDEDSAPDVLDKLLEHVEGILGRCALELVRKHADFPPDSPVTIADRAAWLFGILDRRPALSPIAPELILVAEE